MSVQPSLKQILLEQQYVSVEDWASVTAVIDPAETEELIEYFVAKKMLSRDLIREAYGEFFGVPPLYVDHEEVDEAVFHTIPQRVAKEYGVFAFHNRGGRVLLGMIQPHRRDAISHLTKRFDLPIEPHCILMSDMPHLLKRYRKDIKEEFAIVLQSLEHVGTDVKEYDKAVVDTVHMLLEYGYENRASDIHIEPEEYRTIVRYRIDGVLHDMLEIPETFSDMLLSRIKVLAKMRTDEHRAAQDGKLRFTTEEGFVDVRVSVVPVTHGENVVMRLLASHNKHLSLEDLGFSKRDMDIVTQVIKNPHGMILVTGPTGSGKTTTLYAVMKLLNTREVHISTIEDPVEYALDGVSQIQVNAQTNLTFAAGLRAIVRQDPDIIMVGEIRDEETASIAVNSALTGHLVLSTLHTNDAATTLPRLIDMSVEPFLVASTVHVAIGQRLVRKICSTCKVSAPLSEEDRSLIELHASMKNYFKKRKKSIKSLRLYKGKGCSVCGNSGYTGRIGVFELLVMTDEIKRLILQRASSDDILAAARKAGMQTMMEDGLEKVLVGETTLSEVIRVAAV